MAFYLGHLRTRLPIASLHTKYRKQDDQDAQGLLFGYGSSLLFDAMDFAGSSRGWRQMRRNARDIRDFRDFENLLA